MGFCHSFIVVSKVLIETNTKINGNNPNGGESKYYPNRNFWLSNPWYEAVNAQVVPTWEWWNQLTPRS